MNLTKQFFKYVSQNIFGLIGTSCYILADTYFIAQAAGTDGVTLLNLCLPMYNLIFAFGSMIGLGAATRYAILQAQGEARAQRYFSNAILCACLIAIPFMLAGAFCPGTLLQLMGGDADIVALGLNYTRIFLLFTPFFMCNYILSAFVRNDGDPSLAMVATLSGSLFNVVFDYIFIFPMELGLPGAALATAISPVLSIAICSRHFFQKSNTLTFVRQAPSARLLVQSCQLGISGFVGELSSAVTTTVFNFLLLRLAGNVGVAAYGVVANFALVATAIFNGVAQGAQPLISQCYGKNEMTGAKKLLLLGCGTALALAAMGQRVLCLDCDITLRNLDLALGLSDRALMDFSDVLEGRCTLHEAAVPHERYPSLSLLTAPMADRPLSLSVPKLQALAREIRESYDWCLIDAPAGLGQGFQMAACMADQVIVITTTDVSAMRDAQRTAAELSAFPSGTVHLVVGLSLIHI